ncbi:MAG: hypothetical protein H0T73_09785 [Ardenticatenales bacterium]|nr:hypothetical protein [Ardenticatenales bacterium]
MILALPSCPPLVSPVSALPRPTRQLLISGALLLDLWEGLFTDEALREVVVMLDEPETLHAPIQHFLKRVSAERFPLDEAWLWETEEGWEDDAGTLHPLLYGIPLLPLGIECSDNAAEWGEPVRWLFRAAHHLDTEATYPDFALPEETNLVDLAETLEAGGQLPPMLAALPALLRYVCYATGNPWLDVCPDCYLSGGEAPAWDVETVQWLAHTWREADLLLRGIYGLVAWVEEALSARLATIHHWLLVGLGLRQVPDARQLALPLWEEEEPNDPA